MTNIDATEKPSGDFDTKYAPILNIAEIINITTEI